MILLLHKFSVLFFQILCGPTKTLLAAGNGLVCVMVTVASIGMCLAVSAILQIVLDK